MLTYLNCHVYIVFVMVFALVSRFGPGSNLLVCLYLQLVVAGYYYLEIIIIIIIKLAQVTYNQVRPLRINYLASSHRGI